MRWLRVKAQTTLLGSQQGGSLDDPNHHQPLLHHAVQRTLAACHIDMGVILAEDGWIHQAEDAFRKVVEISQKLVDADPGGRFISPA